MKHKFRSIGRSQVDQCSTKTWQIFRKDGIENVYQKNLYTLVVIEPKLTKKTTTWGLEPQAAFIRPGAWLSLFEVVVFFYPFFVIYYLYIL